MSDVPADRIRLLNPSGVNHDGQYVLYWMTAFRRPFHNFALQRAVEQAKLQQKPLLILEALRADYPHASDRFHAFILQGMAANAEYFQKTGACYYPYVETAPGFGKGLLKAVADAACLVIADDCPGFFYPRMLQAAAAQVRVCLEAVDSNGLLPLAVADQAYPTAYAFRRFLQRKLPAQLFSFPQPDPLGGAVLNELTDMPKQLRINWPAALSDMLRADQRSLSTLPIDHSVAPTGVSGGWQQADYRLDRFLEQRLQRYLQRSEPELEVSSGLSPYLHFGHIGTHQIVARLLELENWSPDRLSPEARGKRSGWWGLSEAAESFLDELVTWREVGLNAARHLPGYDRYETLPGWAKETMGNHRDDPRTYLYELRQLEQAKTHDPLWNAAQAQLLREGRIQNYLRMLWGKKILEWSPDAETALEIMTTLNDRYALDGRDPNSVSGVFWCLGRYDRAWGPQRPIFGKVRYMSSENTARKFSVTGYLEKYAPDRSQQPLF